MKNKHKTSNNFRENLDKITNLTLPTDRSLDSSARLSVGTCTEGHTGLWTGGLPSVTGLKHSKSQGWSLSMVMAQGLPCPASTRASNLLSISAVYIMSYETANAKTLYGTRHEKEAIRTLP